MAFHYHRCSNLNLRATLHPVPFLRYPYSLSTCLWATTGTRWWRNTAASKGWWPTRRRRNLTALKAVHLLRSPAPVRSPLLPRIHTRRALKPHLRGHPCGQSSWNLNHCSLMGVRSRTHSRANLTLFRWKWTTLHWMHHSLRWCPLVRLTSHCRVHPPSRASPPTLWPKRQSMRRMLRIKLYSCTPLGLMLGWHPWRLGLIPRWSPTIRTIV